MAFRKSIRKARRAALGICAILTRTAGQRLGHAVLGIVGLWSLIAALAFSGSLLTWLVFADAIALGVIALGDLTAHEVTT